MARVSIPTKFGLKINVMFGWILCTLWLSEWSRLGLASLSPSPRTRPNMMPLFRRSEEFRWFRRIIPSFLDSSHFFLRLQRSGPRKPGKCEVWNYNSAELRNQRSYETYKQFHFREATSNRRVGSLLWHLGDNKRAKESKKLPPIPFFCESSIKYNSETIILTGSPHQVGKSG